MPNDANKLKPCPFCGAVGRDLELRTCATERSGVWTWYNADVHCRVCRVVVYGHDTTDRQDAVATAIAAWNRRAGEEAAHV